MAKLLDKIKKAYDTTYRAVGYSISSSSIAGLGNGLASDYFKNGFGEGFVNHFTLAFPLSCTYPVLFERMRDSKHYRLYANSYHIGITTVMCLFHYIVGTENPIETVAPIALISFPILNRHVSETKNIENIVKNETKHKNNACKTSNG
ncbi:hypothetical protein ACFL6I_17050 [candidate division KSB1 bacterium]